MMLNKKADLNKLIPPISFDSNQILLDEAMLKLNKGLGLRDISSARRLIDPHQKGFFTIHDFEIIVKVYHFFFNIII